MLFLALLYDIFKEYITLQSHEFDIFQLPFNKYKIYM